MAHKIESNDGAIFFSEPAWHGKGKVITHAPDPMTAMAEAGHGWTVRKYGSVLVDTGAILAQTQEYAGIVRTDTNEVLSVQSARYEPVQNEEVYRLAYALGDGVKVESAFTMGGGRRLVVLCRGDSITPSRHRNDTIHRYLALVNSHDGSYTLMALPTSVRVVCHNTASQAIGEAKRAGRAYSVRHKGDMSEKIKRVEQALVKYRETGELFKKRVDAMAERDLTVKDIQRFWVEVYGALYQPIVSNPKNEQEKKNNEDAAVRIAGWSQTFDSERAALGCGPSLWIAANAVTRDIQHGKRRGNSDPHARAFGNLVGSAQDETMEVFKRALVLVGA